MKSRLGETSRAGNDRSASLAEHVALCQANGGFLAALRNLFAAVDADVATHGWACKACGACCDFVLSGHRLYASTGELGLLTQAPPPLPAATGQCPYQVDGKCTAHPRRALGCRVFFCDPASRDWSRKAYEIAHGQIRQLHTTYGLPYAYLELTTALVELFPARPR